MAYTRADCTFSLERNVLGMLYPNAVSYTHLVESVVGLNPQNIFFGFHDAADHVAGQYRFGGVDGVVHVQAVAVEDVQSVARADPDGALVVLVEREDGAVGQSLFVGELSQAVCVGWV